MDIKPVKQKIANWLEEQFTQQPEFFLVDLKIQGKKISVFLDGDRGISIDKCAEFSRWLERRLDGEQLLGGSYILEVSSPGMDNPFRVRRQYQNSIGKKVSVVRFDGIRVDGVLKEADDYRLLLEVTEKEKGKLATTGTREILLNDIKSTKLKINF